ncbi:MAG: FdtA/QdtA family cupin domain-containing protein [Alphaproteobacteria bacterium]|nr:FdtA/QdtA family cupin domain-containing protein [Alphaproteobacteria bacterium]
MTLKRLKPGRAQLFDTRTFTDSRGALSVIEEGVDLPFVPRRLYYLHGSAAGQDRAHHAHRTERQCLIAMAGAVEIDVDDGRERRTFLLDRPDLALVLEPVVWRVVRFRDAGGVLAVLAADHFDADDYISDYEEFRALLGSP